jgi:hypothetical protein
MFLKGAALAAEGTTLAHLGLPSYKANRSRELLRSCVRGTITIYFHCFSPGLRPAPGNTRQWQGLLARLYRPTFAAANVGIRPLPCGKT